MNKETLNKLIERSLSDMQRGKKTLNEHREEVKLLNREYYSC